MHISIKVSKEEFPFIIQVLKEHITNVDISVGENNEERMEKNTGYSEPIPGVTQVSKRGCFKSIPTVGVNGIEYRSRVEAKWAYMFENLGWKWTYEPEDSPGYIPDFCLVWKSTEIIVEVKSNSSLASLEERFNTDYQKARECVGERMFILVGGNIWEDELGTVMGVGINGFNGHRFTVYILKHPSPEEWCICIKDKDNNKFVVSGNTPFLELVPFHKTLNSMWIAASKKTQWKPK